MEGLVCHMGRNRQRTREKVTLYDVYLHVDTEHAILVSYDSHRPDGDEEIWLPKSQIVERDSVDIGEKCNVVITWWLASKKGLCDE